MLDSISFQDAFAPCCRDVACTVICPLCSHKEGGQKKIKINNKHDLDVHFRTCHSAIITDVGDTGEFITEVAFRSNSSGVFAVILKHQGTYLLWVCNISLESKIRIATYNLLPHELKQTEQELTSVHIACADKDVSWSGPPLLSIVQLKAAFSSFAYFNVAMNQNPDAFRKDGADRFVLELRVKLGFQDL